MARARWVSLRGVIVMLPPSTSAPTSPCTTSCMAPFGPFTLTVWPSTLAVTPAGIGTGFFPTRDMACFLRPRLEHRAEDFAADIGVARIVIGHHAFRRGEDRDTETVIHSRQRLHRRVDPPAGLRHPGDLADHRGAVEIFQLDIEFVLAAGMLD